VVFEPAKSAIRPIAMYTNSFNRLRLEQINRSISIILDSTHRIDKEIVIEPAQLDILWESTDSYVPPFYEGKALPSIESTIKVVALPIKLCISLALLYTDGNAIMAGSAKFPV